ncbi:hypothetical protein U1Q18_033368, partial [Sarracenia purpurea var. burkii]
VDPVVDAVPISAKLLSSNSSDHDSKEEKYGNEKKANWPHENAGTAPIPKKHFKSLARRKINSKLHLLLVRLTRVLKEN